MTGDYLTVNGTDYRRPERPVVVVCIDGGDPAHLEHGVAAGIIPNTERWMRHGFHTVAHGTMPSFAERTPTWRQRRIRGQRVPRRMS